MLERSVITKKRSLAFSKRPEIVVTAAEGKQRLPEGLAA
jgi:hypothetical protein